MLSNSNPHRDIISLLRSQSESIPGRTAMIDESGRELTYQELRNHVEQLAILIKDGFEAGRPYRIGIVMKNGMEMSIALLAVTAIGAVLPFDPKLLRNEFESYFTQCELTHLLVDDLENKAVEAAVDLGIPVMNLNQFNYQVGAIEKELELPEPEHTAMVLLTSGSTGRPKRVPLTHKNVCVSADNVARSIHLRPEDTCLSMWELFHVGGLVDLLLAPLHSGGKIVTSSGFNALDFFRLLEVFKPSWIQVVPTTLHELVQLGKIMGKREHTLKFIRSVAAALPSRLMQEAEELFEVPVIQTYGMTEASPLISSTLLPPAVNKPGSVGVVCGGEVSILGIENRKDNMATEGELIIRGENVFSGYEGMSEEEREASFYNGWYRTGDIGHIEEDGTIYLLGRSKEVVNRGGEKVNMFEVEEALLSHPAVEHAACFAVKHPTLGEDVLAAVTLKDSSLNQVDLKAYAASLLAAHKVPREVQILESLPLNKIGKIDRIRLGVLYKEAASVVISVREGDELQQGIAEIWKQEIGTDDINLSDDFLKQGGDSLSAVRMIAAVENKYNIVLPKDILHDLKNIKQLAESVVRAPSSKMQEVRTQEHLSAPEYRKIEFVMGMGDIPQIDSSPLIKGINLDGKKKPLVWFYNSPAIEMRQMSHFLDADIPLYGMYSGGKAIDGDEDKVWRIAQLYAEELANVFPEGGIHLGGNCRGGRLALRVTQILLQKKYNICSLSLQELANNQLYDIDVPILCMFGSGSKHRAYEYLDWGKPGWDKRFKREAYLAWCKGTHGGFFRKDTISSVCGKLETFFSGKPVVEGSLSELSSRLLLRIHRLPKGFDFYRKFYKIKARLLYGKRKEFNPLTGQEM